MWGSLVTQTVQNLPAMQETNECVCMYMCMYTRTHPSLVASVTLKNPD